MKPLSALPAQQAKALEGIVFDLDDTLLDHGALSEPAYAALFRLRETGLRLIACTGRPAGWGEILARQWPIDAIVTENGAVSFVRARPLPGPEGMAASRGCGQPPVLRLVTAHSGGGQEPRDRRQALIQIAEDLLQQFPTAELADDNHARLTDVTIDIGEHRSVRADDVAAMRSIARARGVRTVQSSVHLHLSFEAADKASAVVRLLVEQFGSDATRARFRYAFAGDSANDSAPFAAFSVTFGVSNVLAHLASLSLAPGYLAQAPMGRGFAEIAAKIVALRT